MFRGCRWTFPHSVRPSRLPITPSILRHLHTSWSHRADDYDTGCTWAACCVAFFTFLRCGEFTCSSSNSNNDAMLSLEDVAINSWDDTTIVHLTLLHSNSEIFGVGVTIHLGRTGDLLCPVSALLAYLARRPPTSSPLFLLKSGQPLSKQRLISTVHNTLGLAGVDVGRFNGHSLRIRAATAAAQAGLPDSTIEQLGRWMSAAFTCYLRPPVQFILRCSELLLQARHASSRCS